MTAGARLQQIEAAQAALIEVGNKLAVLNCLLREAGLPPVFCPPLGVLRGNLEEAAFACELQLTRERLAAVPA